MAKAVIVGVGMTPFGKFPDESMRSLATAAAATALSDAGIVPAEIDRIFFSNAVAGLLSGQEMIRGQVSLRDMGFGGVPVINVENACASGSTAVHLATAAIEAGQADLVLVVGAEKLTHEDKTRSFAALGAGVDVERLDRLQAEIYGPEGPGVGDRSLFMDIYADFARRYMAASGATPADFAAVAVKSHAHASLNPRAQYRNAISVEQVLDSRLVSDPLTLLMCSPIGDGAAALVLASPERAVSMGPRGIAIEASILVSGLDVDEPPTVRAARSAYEQAGVDPCDLDLVELHDAAAPAELMLYEELGLCAVGDGPSLLHDGATSLGGRVPVNTSGGLISKGHPVGATGCAQLVELVEQLRGECGPRQVDGARLALAENGGGHLGPYAAAVAVTILSR
jgi:acetyl-CoA acetyltransferase